MARYPLGLYPGWLRLVLTWIIPVGAITTIPAGMLTGAVTLPSLALMTMFLTLLLLAASALFRFGIRHYKSASS